MNDGITATFARRYARGTEVRVEDLRVADRIGVTVLFGASGAGKTTVLRCLAGLEVPDEGTIRFGDETWSDAEGGTFLPPQRRRVGFVPQDYALFPHLTVAHNLEYGLHGLPTAERRARIGQTVEWLGLNGLEKRLPRELSGGQQQRVALGRAVAPRPRLLLLDEPLAALDTPARARLRGELGKLLAGLALPTVLVTHDRTEALVLGTDLIVMDAGRIIQTGPVTQVFSRPLNLAAAGIVGVETVQSGRLLEVKDGLATVAVGGVVLTALAGDLPTGVKEVFVCVRAEDVILSPIAATQSSPRNRLVAMVRTVSYEGPLARLDLDCGFPLAALLTKSACQELGVAAGSRLLALVKVPQVHLIPR